MGRYAVVKTGGKQYRVAEGELLDVERLGGEVGATVTLDEVLLVSGDDDEQARIGTPVVEQAQVTAEIVKQGLDKKIIVFKKKRRKGYKRKQGHRQRQTTLRIVEIQA
jgi:large subunit ribosomal protein L21